MGRKPEGRPLTRLELEIMEVLWELESGTVQQVLDQMPPTQRLAYTTVQTMLTVLYRKGKVTRTLKGKAYEYAPALSRKKATHAAVRETLNRFFGGSAESLVMSLVENRQISAGKLAKLTRLIEETEAKERKG